MKNGVFVLLPIILACAEPSWAATQITTINLSGGSYGSTYAKDNASLTVQTGIGSTIPGFDATLGTLTSVDLTIRRDFQFQINLARYADDINRPGLLLDYSLGIYYRNPVGGGGGLGSSAEFMRGETTATITDSLAGQNNNSYTADYFNTNIANQLLFEDLTFSLTRHGAAILGTSASVAITSKSFATVRYTYTPLAAVPEPASWAMMVCGFGLAGAAMRRRRRVGVDLA